MPDLCQIWRYLEYMNIGHLPLLLHTNPSTITFFWEKPMTHARAWVIPGGARFGQTKCRFLKCRQPEKSNNSKDKYIATWSFASSNADTSLVSNYIYQAVDLVSIELEDHHKYGHCLVIIAPPEKDGAPIKHYIGSLKEENKEHWEKDVTTPGSFGKEISKDGRCVVLDDGMSHFLSLYSLYTYLFVNFSSFFFTFYTLQYTIIHNRNTFIFMEKYYLFLQFI